MEKLKEVQQQLEEIQKSLIKHNKEVSENLDKMISILCVIFEGVPGENDTICIVGTGYTEFITNVITTIGHDTMLAGAE